MEFPVCEDCGEKNWKWLERRELPSDTIELYECMGTKHQGAPHRISWSWRPPQTELLEVVNA